MGKLPFLFQGIKTSEFSAKRGRSRYSCPLPRRITGTCFIFLPTVCHSRAKTISPVRSKKPMSSYNKVTVIGTAASRVFSILLPKLLEWEGKWSGALFLELTRSLRSQSAASLIRSIRCKQVVPPFLRCVRVIDQEIEQAMSKSGCHEFQSGGIGNERCWY